MAGQDGLVIYHVGGDGGYGPIQALINLVPGDCTLVVFDIRDDTGDVVTQKNLKRHNVTCYSVNRCVSSSKGRAPFHITRHPRSSSMLPPAKLASDEHPGYRHCITWAENTEIVKTIEVETISIDDMVADQLVPPPDVISIDAQGAEVDILKGAEKALRERVVAVVSEVEFDQIYEDQGLFCDQYGILKPLGFRLMDIMNRQYWHLDMVAGDGFLTVGEAVFLRDIRRLTQAGEDGPSLADKVVRLIPLAVAFNRLSYAYMLYDTLKTRFPDRAAALSGHPLFAEVGRMHEKMASARGAYLADNRIFRRSIGFRGGKLVDERSPLTMLGRQWDKAWRLLAIHYVHPIVRHMFSRHPGIEDAYRKLAAALRGRG